MTNQLVFPMAAYVLYMWCLAVLNFRTRVGSAKRGEVDPKYFKALQGSAPERVITVGRHFDNQFQAPVIFLIGCVAHMVLGKANDLTIVLAWAFIVTRLAHSFIHLGGNKLRKRVMAFAAGWLVMLVMYGQLVYFAL
jgi:hypothetical protein